jgi:hypothetical protein
MVTNQRVGVGWGRGASSTPGGERGRASPLAALGEAVDVFLLMADQVVVMMVGNSRVSRNQAQTKITSFR